MKYQFSASIILILLSALVTYSQSKTDCGSQHRKELVLTAVDKNGKVIDNLRAEHLTLKLGNSNATIADVIFRKDNQPLDIVVLIDTSLSQEKVLPLAKTGAQSFITSVPTAGRDRVAVVSFSDKANNNPVLTSDFAAAVATVERMKIEIPPGYIGGGVVVSAVPPPRNPNLPGSTSLLDAIGSTAQTLFSGNGEKRRRVMLLFSDGRDTSSSSKLNSVIEEALKYDVAIFSIGLADPTYGPSESTLKKLSEQTGGVASFPKKKEALETALTDVANRLRADYVIGYCGAPNNRARLQVEVTDPEIRKTKPVLAYKRF